MFIERKNGKIELTAEEVEKAYRVQEHCFLLNDAKNHLASHFGIDPDESADNQKDAYQAFEDVMGYPFVDDIDDDSLLSDLEALVEWYEDRRDCNVAENDTWDGLVDKYVAEVENHRSCHDGSSCDKEDNNNE